MNPLSFDNRVALAAANLPLLAKQLVAGFLQGLHRSPLHGSSQEFASYRSYLPGDSIRNIDWNVWARSDNLFVREYQAETNFRGYLFLDASKSMDYGQGDRHKFTYAKILCAALALVMKQQNDAPGVVFLGKPSIANQQPFIAPSTRNDHLDQLMALLQRIEADGNCDNLQNIANQIENCRGRSVSVILSDGYFPIEQGRQMLEHLRMKNHDTIFFHLLSPEEVEPKFEDDMLMVDSETGRELPVDGIAMRAAYAKKLEEFQANLRQICLSTETAYRLIVTSQPFDEAMRQYIETREGQKLCF